MKLSYIKCEKTKPGKKTIKLADGHGLYLEISPKGGKYWRMKYRFDGKEKRLSFGVFSEISLDEAREKRDEARKLLRDGTDPGQHKKAQKRERVLNAANTFEALAREWHAHNIEKWTQNHGKDILHRFEMDIFPEIGGTPVADIQPMDVLQAIQKIEARGAHEMAKRALQNCGRVFRYAMFSGRAKNDPTYKLTEVLKPVKGNNHFAALESKELPEFVKALRANKARLFPHTLYATELLMLTFVRTGELIGAKWEEFDFDAKEWLIPAERMKMKQQHIVPLSTRAVELLEELKTLSGSREYVFPHFSDPRKHMSNNTILKAIDRLGYKNRMTGHGFRALAMSTIKEKLGYRHEVVDRQLAHAPRNKIDAAYDRAKFLDERRTMMQDWSNYIDRCATGGEVVKVKFG